MDITFTCQSCGQSVVIDGAAAGQLVDCPKCGISLEVPYKSKPLQKVPTPLPAKPPEPQPRRSSPLLITAVAVLGLLCVGLFALVLVLTRSHSTASVSTDTALDGEVFIVTKAGESIKLGLVPVALIPLADLMPYLSNKQAIATNEIARLGPLIQAAESEDKRIYAVEEQEMKRLEAEWDSLRAQVGKTDYTSPVYETLNKKSDAAFSAYMAASEKWRTNDDWMGSPKTRAMDDGRAAYYHGAYYFDTLPACLRSAKTNGDGKFQMQVPRSGSYALAAVASRQVGEYTERYYWLIRIDPHGESQGKIMLSNDNQLDVTDEKLFHGTASDLLSEP